MTSDKPYYSIAEVSKALKLSRQAVHARIRRHNITAVKLGKYFYISADELEAAKEYQRHKAGKEAHA